MIEQLVDSLFGIGAFTAGVYMSDKAGESFYLLKECFGSEDRAFPENCGKPATIYEKIRKILIS